MHRRPLFASLGMIALVALAACSSSSTTPDNGGGTGDDAGGGGTGDDAATGPTWSSVYAAYFAPGTPGHCSNAGCHAASRGGFKCGTTKDTCYQGLIDSQLVSTSLKEKSPIAGSSSPLVWFNSRGTMPDDNRKANAQAASDIKTWLASGAENN